MIASLENTTDEKFLSAVQVAMTSSPEAICTTVPAGYAESKVATTQPCSESASGATAIPEDPTAISVPPLIVNVPLTSSAPLPSFVGPLTTTVPPVMVASPLESSPSPPASMVVVPPLTVTLTPAMPDSPPGAAAATGSRRRRRHRHRPSRRTR